MCSEGEQSYGKDGVFKTLPQAQKPCSPHAPVGRGVGTAESHAAHRYHVMTTYLEENRTVSIQSLWGRSSGYLGLGGHLPREPGGIMEGTGSTGW